MLERRDADHEETAPQASTPLINRLACPLVGQTRTIRFVRGTIARQAYGVEEASEHFRCNFGLNPAYRTLILSGPLECTGVDREGEARVIELRNHPFFIATLYLPQLGSHPGAPHPLITAYLSAAVAFHDARNREKDHGKAET